MIAIHARFDGKVLVPDQPLDLPANQRVVVRIEPVRDETGQNHSALQWIAENAVDAELPEDLAHQHDHYLYGKPKKD
ncbi:MAG: antitoxin family protein [Planctomycetes bacterium]|nr:antitoxin family protein [Planctomycetota bacterium]